MTTTHQAGIRAVLFDFHNTLSHAGDVVEWVGGFAGDSGLGDEHERVLAVLPEVWVRAGVRWPGSNWDLSSADHRRAFTEVLRDEAGCSPALATALYESMPDQWRPAPGIGEMLADLRQAGMRLGVISNIAIDIRPVLETWGIRQAFDAIVLSFEVGLVKPDPAIFRFAAQAVECSPEECLMVGDSPHHDGAAAQVGMPSLIVPMGADGPRLDAVGAFASRMNPRDPHP